MTFKILTFTVTFILIYLAALSYLTRQNKIKPIGQRTLIYCPNKPNCVYSQSKRDKHKISALSLLDKNKSTSWNKLIHAIEQSGGEILINDEGYCHAVFTSGVFRFKDDLEVELSQNSIDIRSASRAGTSDFGQNRKRVERIRQIYNE